jgi:hypothetical protein
MNLALAASIPKYDDGTAKRTTIALETAALTRLCPN